MARDNVTVLLPIQEATQSVELGNITKQAVTQANGIKIEKAFENKNNSLIIFIENTANADKVVTIKKSDEYVNAMLGDKDITIGTGKTVALILEDISRFEQKDGSILLDFATGFTGNVYAVAKRAGLEPVA